jgi:probable HAF family extracellular repeat protein
MKGRIGLVAIGFTAALGIAQPSPAVTYTFTTIDFPGAVESGAIGINNSGQIVGGYMLADGSRHGFVYSGGSFATVDHPSATTGSIAYGINNLGEIVGGYDLNSPEGGHVYEGAHGFVNVGGVFTSFEYPAAGVINTTALKVNNLGTIVGVYRLSSTGFANGFTDNGAFTTTIFPGGCCTKNNGINDAGDIVGQYRVVVGAPHQGFTELGGAFATLDVPGATETIAQDINNTREIVGAYKSPLGAFGFLYSGGSFTTITVPGAVTTQIIGINDEGDIVGVFSDSAKVMHGFLGVPPGALSVLVDVKPQSCPNPLNVDSGGVLPVAIVGTAGFDVTSVDPSSVRLQGVPALRWTLEDVTTPFTGTLINAYSCTTAGPDGFMDLVFQFDKGHVEAALGPVANGQVLLLTLTGNLSAQSGGTAIKGQDIVVVVK